MSDLHQYGGTDGLDHSREVQRLLQHIGVGPLADEWRAAFLRELIPTSDQCFAHLPLMVSPCDATRAYLLMLQMIAVLGVPIKEAFLRLERFTRRLQRRPTGLVLR